MILGGGGGGGGAKTWKREMYYPRAKKNGENEKGGSEG